jgi:hypothetical protein
VKWGTAPRAIAAAAGLGARPAPEGAREAAYLGEPEEVDEPESIARGEGTLALIVDDNELSKKQVNLYEPIWIHTDNGATSHGGGEPD